MDPQLLDAKGPIYSPSQVSELCQKLGCQVDELLVKLIRAGQDAAYSPISHYRVGSAALGESGAIYLGFNVEFPGHSLSCTIHAEQAVVALAMTTSETGLTALAVSAPPCGHCRQFLNELSHGLDMRILLDEHPDKAQLPEKFTLRNLLPVAFGPGHLQTEQTVFSSPQWPLQEPHGLVLDSVQQAALTGARRSYAPYSQCPAAIAFEIQDGRVVVGHYCENVAFNPSLPPFQAGVVGLVAHRIPWAQVTRAVLAQCPGGALNFTSNSRSLLSTLAPSLHLETLDCLGLTRN